MFQVDFLRNIILSIHYVYLLYFEGQRGVSYIYIYYTHPILSIQFSSILSYKVETFKPAFVYISPC